MITTKKGDDGKSRWMGKTVDKDDLLLETVGSIDELQAILFLIKSEKEIINDLFLISGELSCDIKFNDLENGIKFLEEEMEELKKQLKPIKGFLTFNKENSVLINLARTICRRVERRVVTLYKRDKINKDILVYFNRLSDYLFILSVIKN